MTRSDDHHVACDLADGVEDCVAEDVDHQGVVVLASGLVGCTNDFGVEQGFGGGVAEAADVAGAGVEGGDGYSCGGGFVVLGHGGEGGVDGGVADGVEEEDFEGGSGCGWEGHGG